MILKPHIQENNKKRNLSLYKSFTFLKKNFKEIFQKIIFILEKQDNDKFIFSDHFVREVFISFPFFFLFLFLFFISFFFFNPQLYLSNGEVGVWSTSSLGKSIHGFKVCIEFKSWEAYLVALLYLVKDNDRIHRCRYPLGLLIRPLDFLTCRPLW